MTIYIGDFEKSWDIDDLEEISSIFMLNYDGYNMFNVAFSEEEGSYPNIMMMTNNDLAAITYYQEEGPAFNAIMAGEQPEGDIKFKVFESDEQTYVPKYNVISIEKAIDIVIFFCNHRSRSPDAEWEEL